MTEANSYLYSNGRKSKDTADSSIVNFETFNQKRYQDSDAGVIDRFLNFLPVHGVLSFCSRRLATESEQLRVAKVIAKNWYSPILPHLDSNAFEAMVRYVVESRESFGRAVPAYKYYTNGNLALAEQSDRSVISVFEESQKIISRWRSSSSGRSSLVNGEPLGDVWEYFDDYVSWDCKFACLIEDRVRQRLFGCPHFSKSEISQQGRETILNVARLLVRLVNHMTLGVESYHRLIDIDNKHSDTVMGKTGGFLVARDNLIRNLVFREQLLAPKGIVIVFASIACSKKGGKPEKCWNTAIQDPIVSKFYWKTLNRISQQRQDAGENGESLFHGTSTIYTKPGQANLFAHTRRKVCGVGVHILDDTELQKEFLERKKTEIVENIVHDAKLQANVHTYEETLQQASEFEGDDELFYF